MTNAATGARTYFEILPGPSEAACESGQIVVLHISKDSDDTYWAVSFPKAEAWVYLLRNPDGSWRSILEQASFPAPNRFGSWTQYPTLSKAIRSNAETYILVPKPGQQGEIDTSYRSATLPGFTTQCQSADAAAETSWTSKFYWDQVNTPAYTGLALVNDQLEGNSVHEKWSFAPGIGLVEIDALTSSPPVMIKREAGQ